MSGAGAEPRGPKTARLGVDGDGRSAVLSSSGGFAGDVFSWGENWCEVVEFGNRRGVRHFNFEGDRLVEEVEVTGGTRLDGEVGVTVTRWHYDENGRPVLAVETYESGWNSSWGGADRGPHWRAKRYRLTYDAGGELGQIWCAGSLEGVADGYDVEAAQAAALTGAAELFTTEHLMFDGRTQRIEEDLPEPSRAFDGVAEPLAEALQRALLPQLAAIDGVAYVLVGPRTSATEAIIASTAFVERARRMGLDDMEIRSVLPEGPKGTVAVDAIDVASPELLRALRRGNQAFSDGRRAEARANLATEVVAQLGSLSWRGLAKPPTFVTPPRVWPRTHGRQTVEPATIAAPADRPQLRQLLRNAGLDEDEARIVEQDARWALGITAGGNGSSRLGGAPLLAPGTPWPTAGGRPLTHLATIAFDELPAFEDRGQLPADGLLSFFVDLSDEGLVDIVEPGDSRRDLVRFLPTPSGSPREAVVPPGQALPELRVRFEPVLQLRDLTWGVGEHLLGLDALASKAVDRLRTRLAGLRWDQHQLLGHPVTVQDDPREPGQATLLRVATDDAIGFSFQDGGDLHLYGAADDLRAAQWDRVTVLGSSH